MQNVRLQTSNKHINVWALAPHWAEYVELHLQSDRNAPVSKLTDVSPLHPNKANAVAELKNSEGDLLFPFIDIEPQNSYLNLCFSEYSGYYCFDPMRCKAETPLTSPLQIMAKDLVLWENNLYISERQCKCISCEQVFTLKPIAGKVEICLKTLSEYWSGNISVIACAKGKSETIHVQKVLMEYCNVKSAAAENNTLEKSVAQAVDFLIRSKVEDGLDCAGGMYLFYDLDKKAYRAPHWNWTYGPAIGALLSCMDNKEVIAMHSQEDLLNYAKSMAHVVMRYCREDGGICDGISLGRWQQGLNHKHGVMGYYSVADSGFCVKHGILPLFALTKDMQYLNYATRLYSAACKWLKYDDILTADYLEDAQMFSDRTIDETMFAMGMFESLWNATGDVNVKETGLRFFNNITNALKLKDGKWARIYLKNTRKNCGFENDTKGHGWAMDGLLCACNMGAKTDKKYLKMAEDTADLIIKYQYSDGHWDNYFGINAEAGIGEKSTALWSWLLYRLYELTNKSKYRIAAKMALDYCKQNMYFGADANAHGSVVALSTQSGVIYHEYFPMSCTYTTSFFILAAQKELALDKLDLNPM